MEPTAAWSRRAADELWSGVVTPLTFSFLADEMAEHMARRRLAEAGFVDLSREPVFRLFRGYVYVNASLMAAVMREVPSALMSEGLLALLPEALRREVEAHHRGLLDPRTMRTVVRLTLSERGWMPWSSASRFRDEAVRVATELAGFEVAPGSTPAEIASRVTALRARLGRFLEAVSWPMVYAYVFFHLTEHLVQRWAPAYGNVGSQLLAGIPGIRTFEVHDELVALGRLLRLDDAARSAVSNESPERVWERASRGELGRFGVGLKELREKHGHRLVGRDLSHATWAERPELLVEIVRRLAAADGVEDPEVRRERDRDTVRKITDGISAGPLGTIRGAVFRSILELCREYYAVRENMRYHADYFLSAFRRLALSAGERLAAAGTLGSVDDVFYLTADELLGALSAASDPDTLGRVAARRREEYEEFRVRVPAEVLLDEIAAPVAAPSTSSVPAPTSRDQLIGVGAAPGCVDGRVRVIRRPEDLESVQAGDIVVATATDPTWTSFLALAAGLVLEVGGLLSHGAIVARELGIPAVVDVRSATRTLRTGDSVRVDGSAGTVTRAS